MKNKALLILAHQGRSYIKLLREYLDDLGVSCLVLSSQYKNENDFELLRSHCDQIWLADDPYIRGEHVEKTLSEAQKKYDVVNVLATFEAYRLIMAEANKTLSGLDALPEHLAECMDKFICRRMLGEANLSTVDCFELDQNRLENLQQSGAEMFIKPRRGAGSFACFKLTPSVDFDRIEQLQGQMQSDAQFSAIFNGQFGFIAETYITGDEYSFETIVIDNECYVIGVHAKYIDESQNITLEVSNSLPAVHLSDAEQLAGEEFVASCLKELQLDQGVYHIETRFDKVKNHWEIIEVNTRMGGALINQSVEVFTEGESVLGLWVKILCQVEAQERQLLVNKLETLRESYRRKHNDIKHGSVFMSRYGEPGKTIQEVSVSNLKIKPDICDIPVRPGTRLAESERGIFILNALWKVQMEELDNALNTYPDMLDDGLIVEYEEQEEYEELEA